jgi:hypothetical protein
MVRGKKNCQYRSSDGSTLTASHPLHLHPSEAVDVATSSARSSETTGTGRIATTGQASLSVSHASLHSPHACAYELGASYLPQRGPVVVATDVQRPHDVRTISNNPGLQFM